MRIILFILSCISLSSYAGVIKVGREQQHKSVTAAIDVARAGDTVLVDGGIYYEKNLVINKPIVLKGVNQPVLDAEKKYENISVKSDNVTIQGFVLQHTGVSSIVDYAAVKIYNSRNVSVIDNIVKDAFFGIYSQYGTRCLIKNNTLTAYAKTEQSSGNGIHCWKSDSMQIIGNTVTGHRDGIYFEFVTNSVIWRNQSFKNLRYGLHFMFSNNDAYINNVFQNNGAGVAVMFSKEVKMFNNFFQENWGDAAYGILLKEINDSYIEGNHFEKNTSAIYAEGANRIFVKRNIFKNNGWAFKIQASCSEVMLEYNNFLGNIFDVGTNGSLVLNRFNNNYWDKYEGYDLNRDNIGDIPYRPVSMYSMIVERNPPAVILFHSMMVSLMDKSEKIIPSLTPENLKDEHPMMKPLLL
ncbi:MAG: nitrous oxide reductase family maturation protein NosD [Terrimonas sp.]|nr:nitrous oxide reductase family maturation protein NosD [Terrimonas sp.]OJY79622.1 MAG: nitrous oxide reductase [Sphingobacteriales bacterium 40-81]